MFWCVSAVRSERAAEVVYKVLCAVLCVGVCKAAYVDVCDGVRASRTQVQTASEGSRSHDPQ